MFSDWAVTPPSTADEHSKSKEINYNVPYNFNNNDFFEDFEHYEANEWEVHLLHCLGDISQDYKKVENNLKKESFLKSGENKVLDSKIPATQTVLPSKKIESIHLFHDFFVKGSALFLNFTELFQFVRKNLQILVSQARSYRPIFRRRASDYSRPVLDFAALRRQILEVFFFIRNFLTQMPAFMDQNFIIETIIPNLVENLLNIHLQLGSMNKLTEYTIVNGQSRIGNRSTSAAYHLFHIHLELRWLIITSFYQILRIHQEQPDSVASQLFICSQSSDSAQSENKTLQLINQHIQLFISELIYLALFKFKKCGVNDLLSSSPFSCSCVFEVWILLYTFVAAVQKNFIQQPFWSYINEPCNTLISSETFKDKLSELKDCSKYVLPQFYECSNPYYFIFWLLKHITKISIVNNQMHQDLGSNYQMLGATLKKCLNDKNVEEAQLRQYLSMIESLVINYWEPRSEIFFILWEHFQNRLNHLFLLPGANLNSLELVSKSALGFLSQVHSRLDVSKHSANMNSFQLFLRLIGLHLQRTEDSPNFWKQIKGRIFSKFSEGKINSFSEVGVYHFCSLFLTLGVSADVKDVSEIFIKLLRLLKISRNDTNKKKLIWKAHLAFVLLNVQKQNNIGPFVPSVLELIDSAIRDSESADLMSIFIEALRDLLDMSSNLQLGQHLLIGKWIPKYLMNCSSTETSRLLDYFLFLINKYNIELSRENITLIADNQLIVLHNELWNNLVPFLRQSNSKPFAPYQIADVAAAFTLLSLKIGSSNVNKVSTLFRAFVTSENVTSSLLQRYLFRMMPHKDVLYTLTTPQILIQAWVKCCLLNEGMSGMELKEITEFIVQLDATKKLFSNTNVNIIVEKDTFIGLLKVLQEKYAKCLDMNDKKVFLDETTLYFNNLGKWLRDWIKVPKSEEVVIKVYERAGFMVSEMSPLIYTKSKLNSLLQQLLDSLLLPIQVRNPAFALHPYINKAIYYTLHFYISGLVKLGIQNDPFIHRNIRELITIYLPRLVRKFGESVNLNPTSFLAKSFSDCQKTAASDDDCCKIIFQNVSDHLIKKRYRGGSDPNYTPQALIFIHDIVKLNCHKPHVLSCAIEACLGAICNVAMFYEKTDSCQKNAEIIIQFILNLSSRLNDSSLRKNALNTFSKLCEDHLAFFSHKLFDLLVLITRTSPQLIKLFLPQLMKHIETLESKRGVGRDWSLRDRGIKRIEQTLSEV